MQVEIVATGCWCVACLMSDRHPEAFEPCRGNWDSEPHEWRFDPAVILFFQDPVHATQVTVCGRPGDTAGLQ